MATPLNKTFRTRRLTVCSKTFERVNSRQYARFPIISLSGKWLQESGFKIGHMVNITCEEGKLTITLSAMQPYIHT